MAGDIGKMKVAAAIMLTFPGVPYLYYEDTEGGHANGADPHANAVRWGMHYTYLMQRLMD